MRDSLGTERLRTVRTSVSSRSRNGFVDFLRADAAGPTAVLGITLNGTVRGKLVRSQAGVLERVETYLEDETEDVDSLDE